ncbi:uncharacterized protein BDZ99DRAFT_515058 [Mytilinidion resinicola]|uniref:Uncharacterized protein n=1 Tax=Mytilinidion resinicola TaxID=574789 RepID=A0A6A6Z6N2_9PEZI|nr:uncharacterized protein BDZ99DRAFT_515058 [Mytilinidion resinicola]KAF2816468.1 hypothetical protein BDZ99DRAFT_515058 [Mytilinidion resinicola]
MATPTFLHDVLHLVERNGSQSVPADLAGDIIRGALTFVLKTQHTPVFLEGRPRERYQAVVRETLRSVKASGEIKAQLSPESRTAIETQATLRCLCKLKYNASRHSQEVITWAQNVTEEINLALTAVLGLESGGLATQMSSVVLSRNRAFVCFDVYIEGCDHLIRAEIDSSCERPIYYVQKKEDTFLVRREPSMDAYVASRLLHIQSVDAGPRPYFIDESNPPVYDNGSRLEAPVDEELKELDCKAEKDCDDG